MITISVPDLNDSVSYITIDKTEYMIRFTYNEMSDYWNFGIWNIDEEPIIAMIKIVPNFPITHFYTYTMLPAGVFGAVTTQDRIGRNDFINGNASFVFIPDAELEEG